MSSKVETSRETTRTLNHGIESLASPPPAAGVHHAGRRRFIIFGQAFNPRNKQMNANGKELVLDFSKLSECDTSSCSFECNAALDKKRYEDARTTKALRAKAFFDSSQLV